LGLRSRNLKSSEMPDICLIPTVNVCCFSRDPYVGLGTAKVLKSLSPLSLSGLRALYLTLFKPFTQEREIRGRNIGK